MNANVFPSQHSELWSNDPLIDTSHTSSVWHIFHLNADLFVFCFDLSDKHLMHIWYMPDIGLENNTVTQTCMDSQFSAVFLS